MLWTACHCLLLRVLHILYYLILYIIWSEFYIFFFFRSAFLANIPNFTLKTFGIETLGTDPHYVLVLWDIPRCLARKVFLGMDKQGLLGKKELLLGIKEFVNTWSFIVMLSTTNDCSFLGYELFLRTFEVKKRNIK